MKRPFFIQFSLILCIILFTDCSNYNEDIINPNQFTGSDTERIQAAVDKASKTNGKVLIPPINKNGSNIWLLDHAILLPSNITVILENCTIQLSDQSRDNMFRSSNVGVGINKSIWLENIRIIGIGDVFLKGANNPRATGDAGRTLSLDPDKEISNGNWRVSYGSDTGKEGVKQKGDWRNILILMGYVNGLSLKNINIVNAHSWAISFERTTNAEISNINIYSPENQEIDGSMRFIANRDGIDLRHGCKNVRIDNISGKTGDDFIALSTLGLNSDNREGGTLNSTMVTTRRWNGPEDNTEQIYISNINCESVCRAVAIRANDVASINNVYINGLFFQGGYNALLIGGKGYGKESQFGKINNIHAMNIVSNGGSMVLIENAISDCSIMNGIYLGESTQAVEYNIDKSRTKNIIIKDLVSFTN